MQCRLKLRHLVSSAVVLFAITTSTSNAKAWDPLDPLGTACASATLPLPANLNICDAVIRDVAIPHVPGWIDVCTCTDSDVAGIFIPFPPFNVPNPDRLWCYQRPHCAISFSCGPDPTCLSTESEITLAYQYTFQNVEAECDFTGITPEDLLKEGLHEGLDLAANAALTVATFGGNLLFQETVSRYLDNAECTYGQPLSADLKEVMRAMRDDTVFPDESTFFDDDLDNIRIVSNDDFIVDIPQSGLTLGHIVVLKNNDPKFQYDTIRNWNKTLAQVRNGELCWIERNALALIMHEAVHVRQFRELGKADFVNRYGAEVFAARFGTNGPSQENEAYNFASHDDSAIDLHLVNDLEMLPATDAGCSPPPAVSPPPPGISITPAGPNGEPAVSIISMCGLFGPHDCAPNAVECNGNKRAQVILTGASSDPTGISASEWRILTGTTFTSIGTGDVLNFSFASRDGMNSGLYNIGYSATDNDMPKRTGVVTHPLLVHDTTPPVITLNPPDPITIECNVGVFTEPGATAVDLCDPSILTVTAGGETVDRSIPDTYLREYTAVDDVGNVGFAWRNVFVADTIDPTIVAPPDIITQSRTPVLGTPTMSDFCDSTPLAQNDAPTTFPLGTTIVTWWSVDDSGNMSAIDTQLVTVIGGDVSSAGRDFTCGSSRDGEVYCWGINGHGQLGNLTIEDRYGPIPVSMTGVARQVSAGSRHACMVKEDGVVQCWGSGEDGRLGYGGTGNRTAPQNVSGLTNAVQVSAGGRISGFTDDGHTCAVLSDFTLRCWGEGGKGQLGHASTTDSLTPVTAVIPGPTIANFAVQVSAGGEHSCVVDMGGRISCWGEGDNGRLGNGSTSDRNAPFLIPTVAGRTFAQVDAGERHTCAVDTLGRVWCWGEGDNGRLGLGNTTDRVQPFQVTLPVGATAVQVSAGSLHSCAVLTDGRVFCWGSPLDGRLGDGAVIFDQLTPLQATGITNAIAVSAGFDHTCARIKNGATYTDRCWGNNLNGELGDGTDSSRAIGTPISSNCGWTGAFYPMSGGSFHSCSTMVGATDTRAMCWGENEYGQLGSGDYEYRLVPWSVVGTTGALAAGAGTTHSCSLTAANRVQCWGDNLSGQLGDNTIDFKLAPVLASDLTTYSLVVTGGYHSCGVTTAGAVKCWGNNQHGQIGDGTVWNRLVPTPVTGLPAGNVLWLTAGELHTCAIVNTGGQRQVWCWGRGLYGQLGHNLPFDSWTPVRAGTISDAYMVSAGQNHTCATTTSGAVWCWGRSGSGQLGYNSLSDSWVPVRVIDQTNAQIVAPFATVAAGKWHSCMAPIGPTQQAACWGDNSYGQLGNGSFVLNARSQVVPGTSAVVSVTTGGAFSCAELVDPTAGNITKCWGANDSGQLGDGTLTNRDVPVRVGGACY